MLAWFWQSAYYDPFTLFHIQKIDVLTFCQLDVSLTNVITLAEPADSTLELTLTVQNLNTFDGNVEQLFNGFLDLGLGGIGCYAEHHLSTLGGQRRFF